MGLDDPEMLQVQRTYTDDGYDEIQQDKFVRQTDVTSCLDKISQLDRFISSKIAGYSNPIVETLLLPFALAFNRM